MTAHASTRVWLKAMRLDFTTVAVVPFGVGAFIAWASGLPIHWASVAAGLLAVLFICIACYLTGEVYDAQGDALTIQYGRTKFSGGTLMVVNGQLSPRAALRAVVALFVLAILLGLYITVGQRNWVLLGLGLLGVAASALYSAPPVRLVSRGYGEVIIGFCYGWLTLVCGHATATGHLPPLSSAHYWPLALSIFNVIFLNEFPDYRPDIATGKRNLVVRLGLANSAWLYGFVAAATGVMMIFVWFNFRLEQPLYLLAVLPSALLSFYLAFQVAFRGYWEELGSLEQLCGLGVVLNHLISVTLAIVVRLPT